MSFITDMFKPVPPKTEAPAKAATENVENPGTKEGTDPNNPRNHTENPLDSYAKMFENATKKEDNVAPSFSLDPAVLADVSSKMDFTRGLNPELMKKAQDGDAVAMLQLINEVGRNSYRASLEHNTKLTETHLAQRSEFESRRVQEGVKQQLTSDALSSNANYNHPVIKQELNRIARDFANSPEYADASPQQIASAAKKYLDDIHNAMNPVDKSKDSKGNTKPAEVDYMAYITG